MSKQRFGGILILISILLFSTTFLFGSPVIDSQAATAGAHPIVRGFSDSSEILLSLSGAVKLFGVIGSLILFALGLWLKLNLENSFRRLFEKVVEMDEVNKTDHHSLYTKIETLNSTVDAIVVRDDKNQRYKKELLSVQEEYCKFIKEMPFPEAEQLYEFCVSKCKSFRQFAESMQSIGFKGITTDAILNNARNSVAELHSVGVKLLGREFIDYFLIQHNVAVERYLNNIRRIIEDDDNSVGDRVHEKSMQFMKSFIRDLQKHFIEYKAKKRQDALKHFTGE